MAVAARLICGLAATLSAAGAPAGAAAPILEETLRVPVRSTQPVGPRFDQTIALEVVREADVKKRPFLILQHGRAADAAERARLALPIYPANARYFAEHGFVVLIPLRVGYGLSGGPDVEHTGDCDFKRFADGVAPAVDETRQILGQAATLSYVDATRGIVVGESFGGLVAIATAAAGVPGVLAAVNIAGGDGGDSLHRPDEPCRPDQLRETFARYGRTSRMPTAWLYSANDRLWGPVYPRQWFQAFTQAGGDGVLTILPADKNNGHFIFNRNAPAWHPAFERFVAPLRLTDTGAAGTTGFSR